MAKAAWHTTWTVLPHDPIEKLEANLWVVQGSVPRMPLRRHMTIVRLGDGRLVIYNAIALAEPDMAAIEAWGTPAFLVVPNSFHRLDAAIFKARYPALVVVAGPDAASKVAAAVPVDGGPERLAVGSELRAEVIDGTKIGELVLLARHPDGGSTLVLNDIVFNQPHLPGFKGFVFRALGSTGAARITRIMKTMGIRDRAAVRAHVQRLAAEPGLRRIIVSHGARLEGPDVGATLGAIVGRDL